jgi:SWI/SNF-related matrix-associated actin-dependent regulator 1 of chromatin subfamily A
LGKTVQVISFLAALKERGHRGPHLIVVPSVFTIRCNRTITDDIARSSTLENWCREFEKFAPTISVQTYYGLKEDRPFLRDTLNKTKAKDFKDGSGWEVLITTYNLAAGDDRDRKFFRKIDWDVSHVLSVV